MICTHLKRDNCDLNLYGGRPSRGVCELVCEQRDTPDAPIPLTVSARVVGGNVVALDVAEARRAVCLSCERSNDPGEMSCHCRERGSRPSCAGCRVIWATNAVTACKLGKWEV